MSKRVSLCMQESQSLPSLHCLKYERNYHTVGWYHIYCHAGVYKLRLTHGMTCSSNGVSLLILGSTVPSKQTADRQKQCGIILFLPNTLLLRVPVVGGGWRRGRQNDPGSNF
eukprot:1439627-Amphidinium_carterae.1